MRSRVLGICCVALCVASVVVWAAQDRTAATTQDDEVRAGEVESVTMEGDEEAAPLEIFPVPEGTVFLRDTVWGEGAYATAGTTEQLVFSNTFGKFSVAPSANNLFADDITTIVPADCKLRRYEFPIIPKVNPAGVGGAYTVTFAFYRQCPGSVPTASQPGLIIGGTQGQRVVPSHCLNALDDDGDGFVNDGCATLGPPETGAQCLNAIDDDGDGKVNDGCPAVGDPESDADAPRTIVFNAGANVPLPTNFWLGVRFSRNNAGIVLGTPPLTGFSCDQYDLPSSPCTGWAGGFPEQPHASFNLQIYSDSACANSFTGYKNNNPSGPTFNPGPGVIFADDIKLITASPPTPTPPTVCNMIAYEVAVRGEANYTFDLRRFCNSNVIAGTEKSGVVSGTTETRILRFTFDPPIAIPHDFFLSAKINAATGGVVVAGQQACIGSTADFFQVALPEGCHQTTYPPPPTESTIHAGFSAAITCAGAAPVGACCDMLITDTNGDSVCRQVPEVNCPFPPRFTGLKPEWVQSAACSRCNNALDDDGDGFVNDGCPAVGPAESGGQCSNALDDDGDGFVNDGCPAVGPAEPGDPFPDHPCGKAACCKPDQVCENLTLNECNAVPPLASPRQWQRGQFCNAVGQRCPRIACLARSGECTLPRCTDGSKACKSGPNNGQQCTVNSQCSVCIGGSNNGQPCTSDANCPGGTCKVCIGGPNHGQSCTQTSQCPGGSCSLATCADCNEANCHVSPTCCQSCPPVGCEDSICCSNVCDVDSFCCDVEWDQQCADRARSGTTGSPPEPICGNLIPSNDPCAPIGRKEGARLITIPSTAESDNGRATEDPNDPGFGCYSNPLPCVKGLQTVWYKFVATQTTALLQTCNSNSPANDSLLSVFAVGDPSTPTTQCDTLIPIGCSDDVAGCGVTGKNARVCVRNLIVGNTYYVLVGSKVELEDGKAFRLDISAPCTTPFEGSINNYCPGAATILDGITAFQLSAPTETLDCPKLGCTPNMTADEWYKYTATCTGQLTVDTCGATPGVGPDTNLAIYAGDVCPQLTGSAAPLACNDNAGGTCGAGGLGSKIVVDVTQGSIYKIRLGDEAFNFPSGNLKVTCVQAPCPAGTMTFTNPPNGVVDAGRPHDPNNAASLQGIQTIVATGPPDAELSCFRLCETAPPFGGPPPSNTAVNLVQNPVGTHTITLARPITGGALTTITYTDIHGLKSTGRFSSAPANVNADAFARSTPPSDVQYLVDALDGLVGLPWGLYSGDINRSNLITGADLLEAVDLINGAGAYDSWDFTPNPSGSFDCPLP